ncbi:hypothetical protein PIB30_047143 [Stylosanthes scabra]|uniref:Uncharacterized protein n=1 Tax=Stylosanthes scabra TaxID=79078 RepID=A0ABU6VEZ0_9FABA|nr:hypothetical protein [Stylosanthes scabra]
MASEQHQHLLKGYEDTLYRRDAIDHIAGGLSECLQELYELGEILSRGQTIVLYHYLDEQALSTWHIWLSGS